MIDFNRFIVSFDLMGLDFRKFAMSNWYSITERGDGQVHINFNRGNISDPKLWICLCEADINTLSFFVCITEAYKNGIKTIEPRADQCFAFEQIEPKVPLQDYNQPYPAVVFDLPQDYKTSLMRRYGGKRPPIAAITFWAPQHPMLVAIVFFGENWPVVSLYVTPNAREKNLQESIDYIMQTTPQDDLDYRMACDVLKVCMNLNLFAVNFGHEKFGYKNIKQHRYRERCKPELARRDPFYFGLNQSIQLYRKAYYKPTGEGGSHESPKPHWRKGHYRQQPYGEGSRLRKLVFIHPVFVCPDKYLGPMDTTSVIMKG